VPGTLFPFFGTQKTPWIGIHGFAFRLSANRFIQAAHRWIPGAIENNGDDERPRKSIS
jgi:hypothetical protein